MKPSLRPVQLSLLLLLAAVLVVAQESSSTSDVDVSSSSSTSTSTSSSSSSTSTGATAAAAQPASFKIIGIVLAIASGLFIGSSFVFKKKGLLSAQAKTGGVAGEGHPYLKSPMWWTGMTLMILGEILNFVAYMFTSAILVTPLGALSVVICAILSSIFLKETLTLFGKVGCFLCILGATIIALNGPQEQTTSTIPEFQKLFLSPGFLVYGSLAILTSLGLIFFVAPKYGKTNMLVYISICSMIGGLSVATTQGLGSAILTSIRGDNQFKHWFIYFLLGFVIITLLTEINYLNKALELFNTAMVTPTYYVLFTTCTLVTSVILYQGFKASAVDIVTVVAGFLVICCGITLLQLSKVDPETIQGKIDRKSTILLAAARSTVHHDNDEEKALEIEDPGIDTLRGGFGAIGSIHRAISSRRSMRREGAFDPTDVVRRRNARQEAREGSEVGMGPVRHQLYDAPMPNDFADKISVHSAGLQSPASPRDRGTSISFAGVDKLHRYPATPGATGATHENRASHIVPLHPPSPSIAPAQTPLSADIGTLPSTFPSNSSGFSYPDSYGEYSDSAYKDPYWDVKASTLPYKQNKGLADALAKDFAASTPDFSAGIPASASSKSSRFPLPHFPRSSSRDTHRVPHPSGPPELDRVESEGLVNHNTKDDSSDDDFGGPIGFTQTRESMEL